MKIKFTKLPTTDGTIKVSLDGGQSFTDYNIADIHESGIPLEDNQDFELITEVQDETTITENGTYTADTGKAFQIIKIGTEIKK